MPPSVAPQSAAPVLVLKSLVHQRVVLIQKQTEVIQKSKLEDAFRVIVRKTADDI